MYALNILRADGNFYWLKQRIIINPNTIIQIDYKYSNTTTLGIDYNNNAEWIKTDMYGNSSTVDADIANSNNRAGVNPDFYVEWNSFVGTSDDGTVKFKFKVDAQTGEIFVNEPYGTFETTAFV